MMKHNKYYTAIDCFVRFHSGMKKKTEVKESATEENAHKSPKCLAQPWTERKLHG